MQQLDLSSKHGPLGSLFAGEGVRSLITDEQCQFFLDNGYVAGIKLLDLTQVEALRGDLAIMMKPGGESDPRFYEYNRNEAEDSSKRLFHVLGAWRVSPSFHDLVFFAPLAAAFAKFGLGSPDE